MTYADSSSCPVRYIQLNQFLKGYLGSRFHVSAIVEQCNFSTKVPISGQNTGTILE